MKRKLKTWEQFEEEFKSKSNIWNTIFIERLDISYNGFYWLINNHNIKYFGKEIEVEKLNFKSNDYTHKFYNGANYFLIHESWFESLDVLDIYIFTNKLQNKNKGRYYFAATSIEEAIEEANKYAYPFKNSFEYCIIWSGRIDMVPFKKGFLLLNR